MSLRHRRHAVRRRGRAAAVYDHAAGHRRHSGRCDDPDRGSWRADARPGAEGLREPWRPHDRGALRGRRRAAGNGRHGLDFALGAGTADLARGRTGEADARNRGAEQRHQQHAGGGALHPGGAGMGLTVRLFDLAPAAADEPRRHPGGHLHADRHQHEPHRQQPAHQHRPRFGARRSSISPGSACRSRRSESRTCCSSASDSCRNGRAP